MKGERTKKEEGRGENMSDGKNRQDLKARTKKFALAIVRLYVHLPKTTEAQVLGKQLLRSGTSVGAQYRESFRAKSDADMISKLESVLQELDESQYWLELLQEAPIIPPAQAKPIYDEANELIAIFVTIVKRLKGM